MKKKQKKVTKNKDLVVVRHTIKAVVIQGDEVCKDLIACSIYNTKPVFFICNITKKI